MAEGARLESVYRGNSIQGSNPCLSAILLKFGLVTLESDDVLNRVEKMARLRGQSTDEYVSQVLRETLPESPVVRNGVPLFPSRELDFYPDLQLVNRLRDDE